MEPIRLQSILINHSSSAFIYKNAPHNHIKNKYGLAARYACNGNDSGFPTQSNWRRQMNPLTTNYSPSVADGPPSQGHFAKVLTFRDLIIYGLVYLAPIGPWATFAYVYDLSGGAAVLAYLIGIICMYFTANSYKEISGEVRGAGSVYGYAREAMGVGPGFIAGWMVLLDYLMIPALMYVFAGIALNTLMPEVPKWVWILIFAGISLAINWYGVVMSARANLIFLCVQVLAVVAFVGWALAVAPGPISTAFPMDAVWSSAITPQGMFAATSICVLAFLGFDAITTLTEEVRPEQRHLVGRAVVSCLLIIGVIAVVQTWVMSGLAKGFAFSDLASGVYDMAGAKVSPMAGHAMAWIAALVTGLSITPPMLAAVARVLHAMADGGQLPAGLSKLHSRYHVPQRTLCLASVISIVIALTFIEMPEELTGIVNFGALAAYLAVHLSVIALLAVKRRSGRWIAHLVVPVIGITIIVVVATQMSNSALYLGLGWFAAGLVYYALLKRFRQSAAATPIGAA
ncbi:APC family permease [Noviherbaspirillum sp. CPCC 100848]|uniref:APC family permease n=1 Tax=Noviherbaspirillum album TaxID=3080276 RepID=A0ABU6JGC7_9BURK|nr:APC family permease [Noviherbaspirillum sp. CPCC 100848]MEC4722707.1 APC family permease [Noviherbaspirillum sp. CPCC 100848]